MSSSNESDAFSYNSDHFPSTSSDEEILEDMDQEDIVIFHCMVIVSKSHDFSIHMKLKMG